MNSFFMKLSKNQLVKALLIMVFTPLFEGFFNALSQFAQGNPLDFSFQTAITLLGTGIAAAIAYLKVTLFQNSKGELYSKEPIPPVDKNGTTKV
jgi:hypothetical protein